MLFRAPEHKENSYTCPWCDVLAQQHWEILWIESAPGKGMYRTDIWRSKCEACDSYSIWYQEKMVFPVAQNWPLPHPDIPNEVKNDYLEARDIAHRSPRAAAALLRLAIERLCPLVGGEGQTLNLCIGDLVAKGLAPQVQQMLDTVRVIGNDLVHGGNLAEGDDAKTVGLLFWLVNEIVEDMVARPKRVAEAFAMVPPKQREGIAQRDHGKRPASASSQNR